MSAMAEVLVDCTSRAADPPPVGDAGGAVAISLRALAGHTTIGMQT